MATVSRQGSASQARPQSHQTSHQNFHSSFAGAINPAIFIPISTFPPNSHDLILDRPLSREEQLQRLVTNLTLQHETVKQNMLIVARDRAKELRANARAELDALGDVEEPPPDPIANEKWQKDMEDIARKLRTKPGPNVDVSDVEVRPPPAGTRRKVQNDGDVVMGGTEHRTPAYVRKETVWKIQRLIDDTVDEIADYDVKVKENIALHQSLLEVEQRRNNNTGQIQGVPGPVRPSLGTDPRHPFRRSVSFNEVNLYAPSVNSPSTNGEPPRGILKAGEPSPIDGPAFRRMSIEVTEEEADRLGQDAQWRIRPDIVERNQQEARKQREIGAAEYKRLEEARQLEEMSWNAQAARRKS